MIKQAITPEEIAATFPVMKQLRTHIKPEEYVERIQRQGNSDRYRVAAALDGNGVVRCVAGYRLSEALAWGKFLYVDDLVTDESARSGSFGREMMAWLAEEARRHGCSHVHLDSGVQRHGAHRFYLRERMDITCYHFQVAV